MKDLADKVALVTGAASGIGFGIAQALGAAGMRLALADIREEPLRDARVTLARAGIDCYMHVLDVRDRVAFAEFAIAVETNFGPVQVLCNNAGIGLLGSSREATYADWDWVMGVNVGGLICALSDAGRPGRGEARSA